MSSRGGGGDRVSTKARYARELKILGEVLVAARERQGLRQNVVAARLGLPPSHLAKVEAGTRRLDVIEFVRLARACDLEPSALLSEVETTLARADRDAAGE